MGMTRVALSVVVRVRVFLVVVLLAPPAVAPPAEQPREDIRVTRSEPRQQVARRCEIAPLKTIGLHAPKLGHKGDKSRIVALALGAMTVDPFVNVPGDLMAEPAQQSHAHVPDPEPLRVKLGERLPQLVLKERDKRVTGHAREPVAVLATVWPLRPESGPGRRSARGA